MLRRLTVLLAVATTSVVAVSPMGTHAERAEAPATSSARAGAKQLVAGMYFTCSLSASGSVRCWGDNTYGQLGNGSTNASGEVASVAVIGITNATEITAGAYHACALLADGRVKCWGYGLYGQLGHGSAGLAANADDRSTAVFVRNPDNSGDLTGVTSIGAGYDTTCALLADSRVACWGNSAVGALGNGVSSWSQADWQPLPVFVKTNASTELSGATEIAVGQGGGCAIVAAGAVKCWGTNANGQLGIGNNVLSDSAYAVAFGSLTGVVALSKAGGHRCALTATKLYCAGGQTNRYVFGQQISASTPYEISESGVLQIATTDDATCILRANSTVACVGSFYTFEDSTYVEPDGSGVGPISTFATISELAGATALVGGGQHFCASLPSALKCWGRNNKGQLGNGSRGGVSVPVDVVGLEETIITIADPGSKSVASAPFDISATASSGAAVTLSVSAGSASVCSIAGVKLTILGAGNCVVNGVSSASGLYSGGSGSRTIVVAAVAPTVGTGSSSSITISGASLSATVNARGGVATLKLEFGTDSTLVGAKSQTLASTATGVGDVTVSTTLADLSPATLYYFRFVATNAIGTTSGEIASFTTRGAVPGVTLADPTTTSFGASVEVDVSCG